VARITPRHLLRLYPRAWRERYGDEFLALLEQEGLRPGVVVNVVAGALDAWLTSAPVGSPSAEAAGVRVFVDTDEHRLAPWRVWPFLIVTFVVPWGLYGLAHLMIDERGPVWWIETFVQPLGLISVAWAGAAMWRLRPFSLFTRIAGACLMGGPIWILAVLRQIAS
jgi:hypothetical protein